MSNEEKICCICKEKFIGYGNNPYPVSKTEGDVCCDICNVLYVIPARIEERTKKEAGLND